MKQIPESFSCTLYHIGYNEVQRWLTHGRFPTMRATGGSLMVQARQAPVAHAWSFRRWVPTMRATSGLTHRRSGGGHIPWEPPVVSRTVSQEVGTYHESHQWSHVPSVRRWAHTMTATGGLTYRQSGGGHITWEPPVVSRTVSQEVGTYHDSHR